MKTRFHFAVLLIKIYLIESSLNENLEDGQITTITSTTSESCYFNQLCTCLIEKVQTIEPFDYSHKIRTNQAKPNEDNLLNYPSAHSKSSTLNTIINNSKLNEVTCLAVSFHQVPKLPPGHIYRFNLIASKHIFYLQKNSFKNTQLSSITISRSKLQLIENDAFQGTESTLTALDLSYNELTEFPSSVLIKLPLLQWLNLKNNLIEEIHLNNFLNLKNNFNHEFKNLNNHIIRKKRQYNYPSNATWIQQKHLDQLQANDQILLNRDFRKQHTHFNGKKINSSFLNSNSQKFHSFLHLHHLHPKNYSHAFNRKNINKQKTKFKINMKNYYKNHYKNNLKDNFRFLEKFRFRKLKKLNKRESQYSNNKQQSNIEKSHQAQDNLHLGEFTNEENIVYKQQTNQQNQNLGIISLRSLLLSDNYLKSITGQVFTQLINLESLDLDNNLINQIDGKPFPNSLASLSLANNLLEKIPLSSLKNLKQLKWLQLRGNLIKNLPSEWPLNVDNLEIFDLSHNFISTLNANFFFSSSNKQIKKNIKETITLYSSNILNRFKNQTSSKTNKTNSILIRDFLLDNNSIRHLPENVFTYVEIERLVLSNNRLNYLNENLFANCALSSSLKILDLSYNLFENFNLVLNQLNNLQTLSLRSNLLTKLEDNVFKNQIESLQILDLSSNKFENLPSKSLEKLKKLFKLNLQDNLITKLSRNNLLNFGKNLLSLNLNRNRLKTIDKDTFVNCINLKELRLSLNQLYTLDVDTFLPLSRKLAIFEFNDQTVANRLDLVLPKLLSNLKNVEFLEINHNKLAHFSNSTLNNLSNLVHLNLASNQLTKLEPNLFNSTKHTKLRNIILTDNELSSLDSFSFSNLKQVINIALINNNLSTIKTKAFNNLPQLNNIYLSFNRLVNLESNIFSNLKNIRNIYLQNNLLQNFSLDVFNQSEFLIRNQMILNDEHFISNFDLNLSLKQINTLNVNGINLNLSFNQIEHLITFNQQLSINNKTNRFSSNEIDLNEQDFNLNILTLDLTSNRLTNLDLNFMKIVCKNLIKLFLNKNLFKNLQIYILQFCPNLQIVQAQNNKISWLLYSPNKTDKLISKQQNCCKNLQILDLAQNQIRKLSNFKILFSQSEKLFYLDLSSNQIDVIEDNIFNGTIIEELNLSDNLLTNLPFTLNCYGLSNSLFNLHLDNNQLTSLHKVINTCSNLIKLSLSNNHLTELNENNFNKLTFLLDLNLNTNTIYFLHLKTFSNLRNLRKLNLNKCNLNKLPYLVNNTNLIELNLSENNLITSSIFDSSESINALSKCRKLKTLNLSKNLITEVPRNLWKNLNYLTELYLSFNPIEVLDSTSLSDLKYLRVVDIRALKLKYVDPRIFQDHKHLTSILTSTYSNVRSFRLYDLLAKMYSLRKALIDVQENVLSHQIQWAFGSKLRELTITGQNLERILPDAFLGFYHTSDLVLRITQTNITRLPEGLLRYLTDLKYIILDLSNNKLTTLNKDVLFFNLNKQESSLNRNLNQFDNRFLGGININENHLECSCDLIWFKEWLIQWMRESNKIQLINHEKYLRNYQFIKQNKCYLKSEKGLNEIDLKSHYLKFLNQNNSSLTQASNHLNSQLVSIYELNLAYCSNSNKMHKLQFSNLILIFIFKFFFSKTLI